MSALTTSWSQEKEKSAIQFNGLWINNLNLAIKDPKIGASNTPFYEDKKWGGESWLNLSARYKNWKLETRFDGYQNSILLNPEDVYSDYGIGYVNLRYTGEQIGLELGHFYDQIGNGIIMRSYRDLSLLIDNAILGAKLQWYLPGNQSLMIFGGKPKILFETVDLWNFGGEYRIDASIKEVFLSSGVGASVKIKGDPLTQQLVEEVSLYLPQDSVALYKSSHLYTIFSDWSWRNLSGGLEYAFKIHDTYYDTFEPRTLRNGDQVLGKFSSDFGQVFYAYLALDWSRWNFQLEGKWVDQFIHKSNPFSLNYRDDLHFIPPMAQIQSYRLKARYIPATQFLGEKSLQFNASHFWETHLFKWNNTLIFNLDDEKLYESYDVQWENNLEQDKLVVGIFRQWYHQLIYEGKGNDELLKTWIPYVEYYRAMKNARSIKVEAQALLTRQDKGNLLFAGIEYAFSANWSSNFSLMLESEKKNWYPVLGIFHKRSNGLYGLSYVKQVEGIVCSGGICRFEPAFSGIKLTTQTRF